MMKVQELFQKLIQRIQYLFLKYYKFGIFLLLAIGITFVLTYGNKHDLLKQEAMIQYQIEHEQEIRNKEETIRKVKLIMKMYNSDSLEIYDEIMKTFDPEFVASVLGQESRFNKLAISPKGACGLAQVMSYHFGPNQDWRDPAVNIQVAEKLLKEYVEYFKGDKILALAAYNSGFNLIKKIRKVPDFKETQKYVANIVKTLNMVNGN